MSVRTTMDTNALGTAVSRPGIDPRSWLKYGRVTEVGHDAREGHFADVRLLPAGQIVTCYIGTPYAGNGFGASYPVKVGDTVMVAIADGDMGTGPMIIGRRWDRSDPPPPEVGSGEDPSRNVVIVVEPGQNLHIVVSGGGDVVIEARGGGKVLLAAADGTIPLARSDKVDAEFARVWDTLAPPTPYVPAVAPAPGEPAFTAFNIAIGTNKSLVMSTAAEQVEGV